MYEKLNFENGQVLTAEALNHMENGIKEAGIGDATIVFDLANGESIKETFNKYNLASKAGCIISCRVKGPSDEYYPVLLGIENCGEFVGHRLTFVALGISSTQAYGEGFFHPKAKLSDLTCDSYVIPQDGEVRPLGHGPLLIADEELNPDSTMPISNKAIYEALYRLLAEYAKKTEVPTKVSQLTNDSDFVSKKDISTPDWNASSYKEGHIKNRTHHMQDYMCHYFKGSPINISKPSGVGYVLLAYDTDLADKFIRIEISAGESKTHEFLDAMGMPLIFTWDAGNSTINVESFMGAVETYGMRAYYSSSAKSYDEYFVKLDKGFIPEGATSQGSMVSITYAELVALRDNGELIAGMQYRITDYVTTTAQENTLSAGHQFDVIVTADNENTLNEVARACRSEFDIEKYKDAYSNTSGVKMLYVGIFSHNGKEYHLYEADNHTIQMLVDLNAIPRSHFDTSIDYPYINYPSYTRWNNEGQWSEWFNGEVEGETICFKHSPTVATYFNSSNLAAWQIWYSLDNDAERFAWADTENGKGVIYRMIDEFNNDLPYDFKNIQFSRGVYDGGGIAPNGDEDMNFYLFTFSFRTENNEIIDTSIFGNNGRLLNDEGQIEGVYGNVIGQYVDYDGSIDSPTKPTQRLNDIVFYSHYDFGGETYYGCYSNSFGNDCYYNSFGNSCSSNSFGNSCSSNSFGNDCSSNSFGNSCSSNSFGNSCSSNSFGNSCSSNSFGNDCYSNSFKDQNGIADDVTYNRLDDGVNNVILYYDENNGNYCGELKNHHICRGVNQKTIEIYAGKDYETTYAMTSDGELREFVLGDVV